MWELLKSITCHRACEASSPIFLVLVKPSHLDSFELSLGRRSRIILEIRQLRNPFMKICETYGRRIYVGMSLAKAKRDVFSVIPGESSHNSSYYCRRGLIDFRALQCTADGGVHHIFGELVGCTVQRFDFFIDRPMIVAVIDAL